jgi:hypothetical protein
MRYNPYLESVKVLADPESPSYIKESGEIQVVLEDVNSPVTRKYQEKMYKSIIDKAHIDFGDIPKSTGNIKNYSGYPTMIDTLNTIINLAEEQKAPQVVNYANIVLTAIKNIESLSATYEKGFTSKSEYVAMEYDTYVYFCVEATTALIYSFVDILKAPDKQVMDMKIKNTKLRADEFYFDQLKKFNAAQDNVGIEYRKMLEQMCDKSRSNFTGAMAVGVGTVITAAMAMVPITREVIYQIYNFRGKISDSLDMQAQFLELNKACVEANQELTADKKQKVLKRQEELAKKLRKASDVIRVKSSKSIMDSKREIQKDNKMLSIDNIKDEVSNSPFELI